MAASELGSTVAELVVIAILLLLTLQLIAFLVVRRARSQPCPGCGKRLRPGLRQCGSCGQRVSGE